ncbi:DUF5518 domain-containing protein [Halovivax sp.]|uniref:DUF5518 domain-containing protein n=1 Tax=Halovivax sp. TaxID=1935978 RepID=UPI0025C21BD4|nr:DUF5518 domain-containing protein [Halovivax sp.]
MDPTLTDEGNWEGHPTAGTTVPAFVDWILGAIVALFGLLAIVGGSALAFLVDRDVLAEGIEDEVVTVTVGTTELTEAEQLEVADAIVSWIGTGLLLTGLGMVVFAIGFVVARHRAHGRSRQDEPVRSYGTFALLGAFATTVLSFIPFSPALGGALAGYLERGESERTVSVGTLAGLLPLIPVLAIIASVLVGLVSGMLAIGQPGAAIAVGTAMFFALMLIATLGAVLGALGGYLGGKFAEHRASAD